MERCIFCQGEVDPATGRCLRCHQVQPGPDAGTPARAVASGSVHCPKCGNIARADAHFCPKCGQNLTTSVEQGISRHPSGPPNSSVPPYQGKPDFNRAQGLPTTPALPHQANVGPTKVQEVLPHVQGDGVEQQKAQLEIKSTPGRQKTAKQKDEKSPLAILRERLIDCKSLSRPLRAFVVGALIQIGLVAVLLVTQYIPQAEINSGIPVKGGENYLVPLATSLVLIVSLVAGYCFALAGALRVHWSVRFLVVALVTGILAIAPVTSLITNNGSTIELYTIEAWLRWAQLAILALFWVWALVGSLTAWYRRRKSLENLKAMPWKQTLLGVFGLLLLYYGIEFGIWLVFVRSSQGLAGTSFLLDSFSFQVDFLPFFLVLLVLLSSTDLLDWGQILVKSGITLLKKISIISKIAPAEQDHSSWPLLVLAILAAVIMLVNVFRQGIDEDFILILAVVAVTGGVGALLVRFARIDSDWPAEIPAKTVLVGSICIFVGLVLFPDIVYLLARWLGLVEQVSDQVSIVLEVPFGLATLTIGLFLLVYGPKDKPEWRALGLFLVILALLLLIHEVPPALKMMIGISVLSPGGIGILNAMMVWTSLGTLVWVIRTFVHQRSLKAFIGASRSLATAILLLAGLQVISWATDFYQGIATLGLLSPLLLAGFFLLTTLWSFVTSGEQMTNKDTAAFPREGLVLLNVGYSLVATALVLYFGTLRVPGSSAPANSLASDLTNSTGVIILGIPLVTLGFILSTVTQRVSRATGTAPVPQLTQQASHRNTQIGVVGGGVLATLLVIAFLATNTLPQLVHTSAQTAAVPYKASVPGPGCNAKDDTEGVGWISGNSVSTRCLPTGLQVTVNPKETGRVIFSPVALSRNYSASVHLNLSGFNGCGGIGMHFTSHSDDVNTVCNNGSWLINRFDDQETTLNQGKVAPATTYTLEATSNGSNQRLSINGVQVSTVADGTLTSGTATLELSNLSSAKESAIFSDFVFTPLPASPLSSSQAAYRASIPGPNCDKGSAQWALTYPTLATFQCQSSGLQVRAQAKSIGQMAFTPPDGIFPQNYRVTAQVNFASQFDCAVIQTRALGTDNYSTQLCGDGEWLIERTSHLHHTFLASGLLAPARISTLEVIVDGSNQRLIVNGVQIGSVLDAALSTTGFIGLETDNFHGSAGTVVLSNFVFTPLPASPLASRSAIYHAATPGPGCDQGGGQWALMDPMVVRCQPGSTQFEVPARSSKRIGFTPPGGAAMPANYQVSVQVDSNSMNGGCMVLGLRASSGGTSPYEDYSYTLCSNHTWYIFLVNNGALTPRASGTVASTQMYTLTAAIIGSRLSFSINGVQVGSATDSTLTVNAFTGFGFVNNGNSPGVVVLSNFVFTPLP